MKAFQTIALAFSLFSAIPMPKVEWSKENLRGALAALPLVGLAIGLGLAIFMGLSRLCALGPLLTGAGLTLIPLLLTGGIHMDGFADVVDALSSRAAPEKKREILKDPRCGAFALIWTAAYFIAYFAAAASLTLGRGTLILLACMHIYARALAALLLSRAGQAAEEGLLDELMKAANAAGDIKILFCTCILTGAVMLLTDWKRALVLLLSGLLSALCCARTAKRAFGGFTGDLAGFSISVSELTMILGLAIMGKAANLWF